MVIDRKLKNGLLTTGKGDRVFTCGESVVAAWVSGTVLAKIKSRIGHLLSLEDFSGIPRDEIEADLVTYPWDLVDRNAAQLVADYTSLVGKKRSPVSAASLKRRGVQVLGSDQVYVSDEVSIKPGTLLDAEDGPIYIGRGVRILAHANIMGPASIGDRSWVKVNAQIYPHTTIGPVCKIGGEVEGSIFHGYSNKQHHGFIGHSYIGAWANLGAGTTNSDLKSNYGLVRVQTSDGIVDTGRQFIGLMMGDHSKTAINSMFNTGTIVGVSSNIFGFGFPPKYVPSFSWGAAGETFTTFNIDQAIEMARRVMMRRSIRLLEEEEQLFRTIFALTAEERRLRGMPH